jgi:hypothetical protein
MINEHVITQFNVGVASILNPMHFMTVMVLYLNKDIVNVAVAAP